MNRVVIFGDGDFAEVAAAYLAHDSPYEVVAFTLHSEHLSTAHKHGLPVLPFETIEHSHPPSDYGMFTAIGYSQVNRARERVYRECKHR